MRILDNYITLSIARIFILTVLAFGFLYILIDLGTHLDDFLANKTPIMTMIQYYISFGPMIFVQISPIACLLATLFTYSTLNNNNEIIALRASGLDFWKITRPAIIFGLMMTALVFMVNERFVPQSSVASEEIKQSQIETRSGQRIKKAETIKYLFFYGLQNRLFFIDQYDPNTKTMQGVTIIGQNDKQSMTEKMVAQKGEWTGSAWRFSNCQITQYDPIDQTTLGDVNFFKEKTIALKETPEDLLKQRSQVTSMNIRELNEYISRFKSSGAIAALNNLRVDLHQKIAYPFACIIIIFTGLPFVLVTGKRKGLTFISIGIALGLGLLFFIVNSVGLALGKGGAFPPFISAWFAPMLFLLGGYLMSRRLF